MFIYDSKFIKSAVNHKNFPNDGLREIAVVGRSNVGKSSLINSLLQRKKIARVSSTPGKTRTLNFFLINNSFYLVDLPGYGYAKVSKSERNSWKYIAESYFNNRTCIDKVILLIDSRHDPFESDIMMYNWINSLNYKLDIIATKSDKLKYSQIKKNEYIFRKQFSKSNILFYSSLKNYDRNELVNFIFS